jgi:hypothetical protein
MVSTLFFIWAVKYEVLGIRKVYEIVERIEECVVDNWGI